MGFAPIVERELRQLARRPFTYRSRAATALGATLVGFGVAFASVSVGANAALLGRNLFTAMAVLAFVAVVMAGPVLTADCLSEEKRNGTLGLLFLAGLSGPEVVAGKLTALSLPAVHCLIAVFPIMGFSFLLGGVTGGEFARVALVLMATLLFSLASALAVSSVSREGTRALGGSVILILLVTLGLPGLLAVSASIQTWPGLFAATSPLAGLLTADAAEYARLPGVFWVSVACSAGFSFTALGVAGWSVRRAWFDKPVRTSGSGWLVRLIPWAGGTPAAAKRRRLLLEEDPLVWVAGRKRASSIAIWLLVAAGIGFCLIAATGSGPALIHASWLFGVFYLLHAAIKILIAWDAGRRFVNDRESGALELLLCTPVEARGIWRSWLVGLKRTYLLPMAVLALVEFLVLVAGMDDMGWWRAEGVWGAAFAAGLGLFIADSYAVSWMGVWQGLVARNSTRACLNTMGLVLAAPGAVAFGLLGLAGLLGGPNNLPLGWLLLGWFVFSLGADFAACGHAMLKLNNEFRAAAAKASGPGGKHARWRTAHKAANREDGRLRPARRSVAGW